MRIVKVSERSQGGWKKYIAGRHFTWPASMSRVEAERQAGLLVLAGQGLKRAGLQWTDQIIDATLGSGGTLPTNRVNANARRDRDRVDRNRRERVERQRAEQDTLHRALDEYVAHLGHRDVSPAYRARGRSALTLVKRLAPDVPLKSFDLARLGQLADALHGRTYAPETIRTTLHFARTAFDYLDTRGRWELTRRAEKLLRPRRTRATTIVRVFTPDELHDLYAYASPLLRAALLLGLNCGFTTADLSSLSHEHIVTDGEVVTAVKPRTKTGVGGQWVLWPETIAALRVVQCPPRDGKDLIFRTKTGQPLCHVTQAGLRADALVLAWRRLLRRTRADGTDLLAPDRRLPFKCLRKTGATMIRDVAGLDLAQTYLAHRGSSVAERHYLAPSTTTLADALSGFRTRLMQNPWPTNHTLSRSRSGPRMRTEPSSSTPSVPSGGARPHRPSRSSTPTGHGHQP